MFDSLINCSGSIVNFKEAINKFLVFVFLKLDDKMTISIFSKSTWNQNDKKGLAGSEHPHPQLLMLTFVSAIYKKKSLIESEKTGKKLVQFHVHLQSPLVSK